jgi:hypothetical protein
MFYLYTYTGYLPYGLSAYSYMQTVANRTNKTP